MKTLCLVATAWLMLGVSNAAGQSGPLADQTMVVCLLPLDHADAGNLSRVLLPLLSDQGTIAPYPPANVLIIKDKSQIVKQMIKAVKGRQDLSECLNLQGKR